MPLTTITTVDYSDTDRLASAPGLWRSGALPFEAHRAAVSDGRLTDPYRDAAAADADWVDERVWWVRIGLELDDVAATRRLRLDGVDTVATVWVNGVEVARGENAYVPIVVPAGSFRPGANEVLVRLDPPLDTLVAPAESVATAARLAAAMGREPRADGHGMFGDLRMLRRRKPVVHWGWDFAPSLPARGLAGVRVEPADAIDAVGFSTSRVDADGTAYVRAVVTSAPSRHGERVEVTLTAPDGGSVVAGSAVIDLDGTAVSHLEVPAAALWWPRDLGAQPRYELSVRVGDAEEHRHVGIRTIELDRSDDGAGGRHFRFVVNGVPLFARGACVVPSDLLGLGTAESAERDRALVALAADGEMNMLRVWGGGGYGSDALYAAADELGILIWQDFAFACSDYPEDDELAAQVAAEATFQVRRLAAHPALALWSGNNEVHAMHQAARGDLAPGQWGFRYFHEMLPEIVGAQSPGVAYWPGSPFGENDPAGVNGVADGDRHAWEVWHGLPLGAPSPEQYSSFGEAAHFRRYRYDTGRFISEFGIISAPDIETLSGWIAPEELRLDSPVLRSHIRDEPKEKALGILEIETGLPTDLDAYVRFTQAVQAEGLAFGIAHYRRNEPHTTGTLIWQLNDPWPGISWSLIDYELRTKPAYHRARRAFAPVASSFVLTDDGVLELWLANSTASAARARLEVQIATLDGIDRHRETVDAQAPAHTAQRVWALPAGRVDLAADTVAWVRDAAGVVPRNRLLFAPLRDVPFPSPSYELTTRCIDDRTVEATIAARTALYAAMVTVEGDPRARCSDNAIDLAAGESVTLTVQTALPTLDASRVRVDVAGLRPAHTTVP